MLNKSHIHTHFNIHTCAFTHIRLNCLQLLEVHLRFCSDFMVARKWYTISTNHSSIFFLVLAMIITILSHDTDMWQLPANHVFTRLSNELSTAHRAPSICGEANVTVVSLLNKGWAILSESVGRWLSTFEHNSILICDLLTNRCNPPKSKVQLYIQMLEILKEVTKSKSLYYFPVLPPSKIKSKPP